MSPTEIIVKTGMTHDAPTWFETVVSTAALPVLVGVATYVLTDRIGEWRRRAMYSRLGAAVMGELLEEVRTGVGIMRDCLAAAANPLANAPPVAVLPNASWDGITTIQDEVFSRVLETSRGKNYQGFQPRDVRSHCKNFFVHMNANYGAGLQQAMQLAASGGDWRSGLVGLLGGPQGHLAAAEGVQRLLEVTSELLEKNSKRIWPK